MTFVPFELGCIQTMSPFKRWRCATTSSGRAHYIFVAANTRPGSAAAARLLLQARAHPGKCGMHGSPLQIALGCGNSRVVAAMYLESGDIINFRMSIENLELAPGQREEALALLHRQALQGNVGGQGPSLMKLLAAASHAGFGEMLARDWTTLAWDAQRAAKTMDLIPTGGFVAPAKHPRVRPLCLVLEAHAEVLRHNQIVTSEKRESILRLVEHVHTFLSDMERAYSKSKAETAELELFVRRIISRHRNLYVACRRDLVETEACYSPLIARANALKRLFAGSRGAHRYGRAQRLR